ncbi:MAG: zinc-dependent dehydrogenase [Chloroflexota bacterium]|nr:zinc-dependent dehydrogenase [Chloroflexota bacterium]
MKAAILKDVGNLEIANTNVPICQAGDVLIKVEACAICKTDTKMYRVGQRDLRMPRILGHELSGVVVQVGQYVSGVCEGKRVQVAPGLPCGHCYFCLKGVTNLCDNMSIIGFHYDGGFAEYVLIPQNGVVSGCLSVVPEGLSFEEAALAEPIACCLNAQRLCGVGFDDSVVIIGAGPLGHMQAQVARVLGATTITLIESDSCRLSFAANGTYDWIIDTSHYDPVREVLEITQGRGADVVLCTSADPHVPLQGINMLRKGGRLSFFSGLPHGEEQIALDHNLVHYRQLQLYGAYGCTSEQNRTAIDMLASKTINVDWLISHRISLDEIIEGFTLVDNHDAMVAVVTQFNN